MTLDGGCITKHDKPAERGQEPQYPDRTGLGDHAAGQDLSNLDDGSTEHAGASIGDSDGQVAGKGSSFKWVLPTTLRILQWVLPTLLRSYGLRPLVN